MERVDEMTAPPVIGKFYMVPTILYRFGYYPHPWGHYPVIGTKHDDKEFLKFPYQHYHIDWRFAQEAAWKFATRGGSSVKHAVGQVLTYRGLDHPEIEYKRRRCRREFPPTDLLVGTVGGRNLHNHFFGTDAIRGPHGLICPHRGTSLGSVSEDPDGTVTCPLHGLKFCARTGKSVSTSPAIPLVA